jgi:hypothetical protein
MLCTGHAGLRDRYAWWAFLLDMSFLLVSTWLVALAFAEPKINMWLTPFGWDSRIWIGALSVGTFMLTLAQLKTNWKERADAHKRTHEIYAAVKREAGYLLAGAVIDEAANRRVLANYDMASAVGVAIPESEFLRQKQRHLLKIAISKHLDSHPSASIFFTRACFWIRDNFR